MIIYGMYLNWTYIFGKNFFSAVFWMDHIHFIDYICASVKRFALFSMKNRTHDFINFICVRLIEILNHRIFLWISISCVLQEILNMHLAEENWFIDSFVSFFFLNHSLQTWDLMAVSFGSIFQNLIHLIWVIGALEFEQMRNAGYLESTVVTQ